MRLVGMTEKKMEAAKQGIAKSYVISFLTALVMAYVLAHFIWYAAPGSATLTIGLKTGIWAWLGFVATSGMSSYLFNSDKKPWELYLLETGYYLVLLLGMSVILVLV